MDSEENLIAGVPAIATHLYGRAAGKKEQRRVYRMLEEGEIDGFKLLGLWHIRPAATREHIDQRAQQAAEEIAAKRAQRGEGE